MKLINQIKLAKKVTKSGKYCEKRNKKTFGGLRPLTGHIGKIHLFGKIGKNMGLLC